jgi:hypothetical protein
VELSRKTAGGPPLQGDLAGCVATPASRPDPLARGKAGIGLGRVWVRNPNLTIPLTLTLLGGGFTSSAAVSSGYAFFIKSARAARALSRLGLTPPVCHNSACPNSATRRR